MQVTILCAKSADSAGLAVIIASATSAQWSTRNRKSFSWILSAYSQRNFRLLNTQELKRATCLAAAAPGQLGSSPCSNFFQATVGTCEFCSCLGACLSQNLLLILQRSQKSGISFSVTD